MNIKFQILSGPNIYAPRRLLRISLDLTDSAHTDHAVPSPEVLAALFERIPALREDRQLADAGENSGTVISQTLLSLISFLLKSAAQQNPGGEIRRAEIPGHYEILCDYTDENIAAAAAALAIRLFQQLVQQFIDSSDSADPKFSFDTEFDAFLEYANKLDLGIYGRLFTEEAGKRGISWHRINGKLIQVGQGRYQRRISGNVSDRTAWMGAELSDKKWITNQLLRESNLPVPEQRIVDRKLGAIRAAETLGFPVVVKPAAADHGNGVTVGLDSADQVAAAFELARQFSKAVIVETFIPGNDYRLLVIDGNFVVAAQRIHGHIVGDGRSTVGELVERENARRQPEPFAQWSLEPLSLDTEADRLLTKVDLTETSIPELGRQVFLRGTANRKTGGTTMNVTDQVHPDVRTMAVEAAAVVGLDFAGIDYLTPDVSRSYRDVGGAICEVNCHPGPFVHALAGGDGLSKIAVAYVDYMFPEGATARVSTIALLGGGFGTMCAYMVADVLKESGRTIGIASADGLFVDGKCTQKGDMSRAGAARTLLRHRRIDTAIFYLTLGGIVEEGLAFDSAMVSVIAGPYGDGTKSFDKAEDKRAMAARRLLIDVAENAVVLSADDPLCPAVLDAPGRKDVYLVADREENVAVQNYKSAGHAVVTTAVRSGEATIVVYADGDVEPVIKVSRIPPAAGVSALARIEAAMYAVALGHAFGISPAVIGDRLAGFKLPARPKF